MQTSEVVLRIFLIAISAVVGLMALTIATAYVSKRRENVRHVVPMGVSYGILSILIVWLVTTSQASRVFETLIALISLVVAAYGLFEIHFRYLDGKSKSGEHDAKGN